MILTKGWLPIVVSIAPKSRGDHPGSYKKLLNQSRVHRVSKPWFRQDGKVARCDRSWLYHGLSLVIIRAANARFTHWVSALELDTDSWICQFPNPNCCDANHQLPSRSPGGKRMNLTTAQLEALQELLRTAVDRAARTLEHLINLDVYVETSAIQALMPLDISHELVQQFGRVQLSVVSVNFSGLLNGTVQFLLPLENTARLLSIVNREHIYIEDLNMLRIGTFLEITSVLINHILETVTDQMHQPLHTSIPTYRQTSAGNLLPLADLVSNSMVLLAQMQLEVEPLQLVSNLLLVFRVGSFNTFLSMTPV